MTEAASRIDGAWRRADTARLADGITAWTIVGIEGGAAAAMTGDGSLHELPAELGRRSPLDLVTNWAATAAVLESWQPTGRDLVHGRLVAPLQFPSKVLCTGANYRSHLAEMGVAVPGDDWSPFFFLKPPTTCITGPDAEIEVEWTDAINLDWEAELAVVIGVPGRCIEPGAALSHVAGYCVLNDVSARGRHRRPSSPAPPFDFDWIASKGQDQFCPIGPGIVPSFLVPQPQDVRIELWVNDELKQSASTAEMICPIAELIAGASQLVTLEAGDVIATGTPAGVGAGAGTFLASDDVVRIRASGIGTIENRFRKRRR